MPAHLLPNSTLSAWLSLLPRCSRAEITSYWPPLVIQKFNFFNKQHETQLSKIIAEK